MVKAHGSIEVSAPGQPSASRSILMRCAALGAAVLLTVGFVQADAQVPFRGGIELISIGVTIVDRGGNLVTDLAQDDFQIVEDGAAQTVRYFTRGTESEDTPLHLGLLFDTSGSMGEDISLSRTAAIKFLNALPDAEDMTLVAFDSAVRLGRYSQADFPRLVERIRLAKPDGYTALYDALGVYLAGADEIAGRKILVLYTDGGDTRSSLSWSETLDLLKASDVTVYGVGFLEHQPGVGRLVQQRQIRQMAEITGGRAFFPLSAKDVDAAYDNVLRELRAQYTLGYVSTNAKADGNWRKLEIKLTRPDLNGLRIRSRRGYYAPFRELVP
jgi:Ca-activated chloride channel homolog